MEKQTARVDRQTASLLDITFWSNTVVTLILVGINVANILRSNTEQGALITAASPQLVLFLSIVLIVWMGYSCVGALRTKNRLKNVFITLDESGVSGYSLKNPASTEQGERFSLSYNQISQVGVVEAALTKKQNFPSLQIVSAEQTCVIPAPENLRELLQTISDRIPANE